MGKKSLSKALDGMSVADFAATLDAIAADDSLWMEDPEGMEWGLPKDPITIQEELKKLTPKASIDQYGARILADKLFDVFVDIKVDIATIDSEAAFFLFDQLLGLHGSIKRYVDDRDGCIRDVLEKSCLSIYHLAYEVKLPMKIWVDWSYHYLLQNHDGLFDDLISALSGILKEKGMRLLEARLVATKDERYGPLIQKALNQMEAHRFMQHAT